MGILKKLRMVGHEWELAQNDFVAEIKIRLGNDEFQAFTELCRRYDLFPTIQMIANATDDSLVLRQLHSAQSLLNTGIWLCKQGMHPINTVLLNHAVVLLRISQKIEPTLHWAIGYLALCYSLLGRSAEAKATAQCAVVQLDSSIESFKEIFHTPSRGMTKQQANYRQMVCEIAAGRFPRNDAFGQL